jgi:ankyrin repeat protein
MDCNNTCLLVTALKGHIKMVKYLISQRSQRFRANRARYQLVKKVINHHKHRPCHHDRVGNIYYNREGHEGCEGCCLKVVRYLILNGADPRVTNNTPFVLAIRNKYLEIAKFLIYHGAIPRPIRTSGRLPFIYDPASMLRYKVLADRSRYLLAWACSPVRPNKNKNKKGLL